jgi:ATPase subunit of ABC transporter with duplicated ATPase domains
VTLLARAWVAEPDLLLMDEPTNHLDLSRIGLLQRWLETTARDTPVLVASHDRAFLDAATNRTLFLRPEASRYFALPYSAARVALDEADAADARRFDNDMRKADQLRRQAAKLKNIGINSGSDLLITKTKQLKDRAEKLEESARPAHQERSAGVIKLSNAGTHAKALVAFDNATISAPDGRALFSTGKIWINRGDRVVILGGNGTGKSRMVTRLAEAMGGTDPDIRPAATAILGYADQSLSHLDTFTSPMQAITHSYDVGDQRARGLLAGAGMDIALQEARISALSGGQRARLAMLWLRLATPNFYLLDEPTNHLDIDGQEMLEEELTEQGASCLLVSHDRTFVRNVGTRFWEIRGKKLVEVDDPEPFFAAALAE